MYRGGEQSPHLGVSSTIAAIVKNNVLTRCSDQANTVFEPGIYYMVSWGSNMPMGWTIGGIFIVLPSGDTSPSNQRIQITLCYNGIFGFRRCENIAAATPQWSAWQVTTLS